MEYGYTEDEQEPVCGQAETWSMHPSWPSATGVCQRPPKASSCLTCHSERLSVSAHLQSPELSCQSCSLKW